MIPTGSSINEWTTATQDQATSEPLECHRCEVVLPEEGWMHKAEAVCLHAAGAILGEAVLGGIEALAGVDIDLLHPFTSDLSGTVPEVPDMLDTLGGSYSPDDY
mgnify:CR=1 FL=1